MPRARQRPDPPALSTPPADARVPATDVRWPLIVLAATLVYPVLESRFWSRSLWGANALAFLPAAWLLVPAACALLFVPRIAGAIGAGLGRWRE